MPVFSEIKQSWLFLWKKCPSLPYEKQLEAWFIPVAFGHLSEVFTYCTPSDHCSFRYTFSVYVTGPVSSTLSIVNLI